MKTSSSAMGLSEEEAVQIRGFISRHSEIEMAKIFGSRATGKYRPGSDVDIVIYGPGVDHDMALELKFDLEEESYLPYFFDVISYNDIRVPSLKHHIDDHGIVFYQRR